MDEELQSTVFDAIVLGTGIAESFVAAALSIAGRKIIHLDYNDFYGGTWGTVSLSAIHKVLAAGDAVAAWPEGSCDSISLSPELQATLKLVPLEPPLLPALIHRSVHVATVSPATATTTTSTQSTAAPSTSDDAAGSAPSATTASESSPAASVESVAATPKQELSVLEQLLKDDRRFNIDLAPRGFWSNSRMVRQLVASGVNRYLDFKCFSGSFAAGDEGKLETVPCSKSEVFSSDLSLREKRALMTFVKACIPTPGEDEDPTINDWLERPFIEFLEEKKLSPRLQSFVLYSIARLEFVQRADQGRPLCTTAQGFERVREYISSIGKYGPSPLIFSLYGVSELSQAYCRQAAVHGGIYMLRKTAKALVVDKETNEFRGIICNDGWHLKAHHLVVAPEYLVNSVTAAPITGLARAVCIIDKPLKLIPNAEASFTVVAPPGLAGNPNTVFMQHYESATLMTPAGKYLVHLSAAPGGGTAEAELAGVTEYLFNCPSSSANDAEAHQHNADKPTALWRGFFNLPQLHIDLASLPGHVHVTAPVDEVPRQGFDEVLLDAETVFHAICPDVDFLPEMEEVSVFQDSTAAGTEPQADGADGQQGTPATPTPDAEPELQVAESADTSGGD